MSKLEQSMNKLSSFRPLRQMSRKSLDDQPVLISEDHVFADENEKASIARDFHDDIGAVLVTLKWDVSLLKQKMMNAVPEISCASLTPEVINIENQVIQALERLRRLIAGLRSEIITDLGLKGAIEWQAHEFQNHTG